MKKVLLKIDGMTCSACSSGLEKYLNKQDGIKTAVVNLVMNNANIEYDEKKLTLEQVERFVEKAGFTSLGIDNFEKEEKKNYAKISQSCCFKSKENKNPEAHQGLLWCEKECLDSSEEHLGEGPHIRIPRSS